MIANGLSSDLLMPDYASRITQSMSTNQKIQVAKNSFVVITGSGQYIENYVTQISPDESFGTNYIVGNYINGENVSYNKGASCSFNIPAGWYFRCSQENGGTAYIYPYKN
jgi:hypothetical protein